MQKVSVTQKTFRFAIALILLVSVLSFCFMAEGNVAYASTWGGKDTADLWQYKDDFLDVANAKQTVDGWNKSAFGEKIVIAVIDTGIRSNHELFDGVLLTDEQGNVQGYNAYKDEHGAIHLDDTSKNHGTQVSGVIAMLIKEFGLQDYIKIYTIKANTKTEDSFGAVSLTRAVNDAVAMGADVINMSLGYTAERLGTLSAEEKANFQFALENAKKSAVIVAAAGNESANGDDSQNAFYPAAWDSALGVMNLSEGGRLYDTSNYGDVYDLCAPGHNIYTANGTLSTYGMGSGTSMASPAVAFATALLKLRYRTKGVDLEAGQLLRMMRNLNGNLANDKYTALSLSTLVTQDFDNTAIDYQLPTAISLIHNGKLGSGDYADAVYMRANDSKSIQFIAKLLPQGKIDPDIERSVEWKITRYLADGSVAEETIAKTKGLEFEYNPTRGGDFEITAQLRASNLFASQAVHVEYLPYYVGEVKVTYADKVADGVKNAPSTGVIYAKNKTRFALTGMEFLNPDVETKWFVNGEYVASGVVFEFSPKKAGTYRITAQYGDNAKVDFQYSFVAEVKPAILRPLDLSMLIVGLVLVVGVCTTVTVLVVRKKKAH